MSSITLISVNEAAERLQITPRSVTRRIRVGLLHPVMKLPGRTGAYLLSGSEVDAMAEAEQEASATTTRAS